MKIASDRIKEMREEKNMTQAELANQAGVSRSFIGRIETNPKLKCKLRPFFRLADELDCWIEDLVRRG